MLNELRGIVERPVTQDELDRAKDGMASSLPGAFETNSNAVGNFSNVFTYDLGLDYYTTYVEQVRAVTTDQALSVAKKYVVPSSMVVVAVGDRAKIEPALRKLNLGPIEIRDADGQVLMPAAARVDAPAGAPWASARRMAAGLGLLARGPI